jgi:uncharacterized protein YqjF (DUF2071 family)
MLPIDEYEALRAAPGGFPVMRQRWRSLLFLHFACDPQEIQRTLPPGLTVDTYPGPDGREAAWVGLVPFRMEGVRPTGLPAFRPLSDFPETNVRTYVHREGREPGVWFYSLDAANGIACKIARRFFALPYHHAEMRVTESEARVEYESRRYEGEAALRLETVPGDALPLPPPGSLEFFLLERYLLYSARGDRLFRGRVHHRPYPVRNARVPAIRESLVAAAGIAPRPFIHTLFSPGVDVRVFGLGPIA